MIVTKVGDVLNEELLRRDFTILWNTGGLAFRTERMTQGDSRAVNLVDVDGDGLLDLVFSRRQAAEQGACQWVRSHRKSRCVRCVNNVLIVVRVLLEYVLCHELFY